MASQPFSRHRIRYVGLELIVRKANYVSVALPEEERLFWAPGKEDSQGLDSFSFRSKNHKGCGYNMTLGDKGADQPLRGERRNDFRLAPQSPQWIFWLLRLAKTCLFFVSSLWLGFPFFNLPPSCDEGEEEDILSFFCGFSYGITVLIQRCCLRKGK